MEIIELEIAICQTLPTLVEQHNCLLQLQQAQPGPVGLLLGCLMILGFCWLIAYALHRYIHRSW